MRVLQVADFAPRSIHGAFHAVWNVSCALSRLGHEVTILTWGRRFSDEDKREAREQGVELLGMPRRGLFGSLPSKAEANSVLRIRKPDIVHLQYVFSPTNYLMGRAVRRQGLPYVVSSHGGLYPSHFSRKPLKKWSYWYLLERDLFRKAETIHCITEREKKHMQKLVPGVRTRVVPNCLPVNGAAETVSSVGAVRRERAPGPFRLGYLGRFAIAHKGLDILFETVRHSCAGGPPLELHLYGKARKLEAADFARLRERYRDVPVVDHGPVSGREKVKAFASMDAYIQMSRWEVFGISIIEAAAAGVPLILSDRCDLAEEVERHGTGIVVPLDPARASRSICDFLRYGSLKETGRASRRWALSTFSSGAVGRQMEGLYTEASSLR